MTSQKIENIALDKIEPDPDQPRKYFNEQELNELAETIKVHGVIVPITLRPHSNAKKREAGHYLLDTGERRWRASEIAGKTDIPAIVQAAGETINAGAVLERQLIENTQRADLSALEEGETYRRLREGFAVPIEDLMSRVGKSRSQIYARIGLTKLPAAVKKAIGEGKLSSAIAELVATVGDPKLQEQYSKECLGLKDDGLEQLGIQTETIAPDEKRHDYQPQPLSYRAAKELLRRKYSTRLALAKFDTTDENLIMSEGACGPCPHRSGAQLELGVKGASAGADDVCLKTSCFQEKTDAAWKRTCDAAKARGVLVRQDLASHVFIANGAEVRGDSPYVDFDTPAPYELFASPPGGKIPTYGRLLGKCAGELERTLMRDGTGQPREMLDKAEAIQLLRDMGKLEKPRAAKAKASSSASNDPDMKKERAEQRKTEAIRAAAFDRFAAQVIAGVAEVPEKKEAALWRLLGRLFARDLFFERQNRITDRRNLEDPDDLEKLPEKLKGAGEARGLVVEMALEGIREFLIDGDEHHDLPKDVKADLAVFETLFGGDWDKCLEIAKLAAEHDALSLKASKEAAKLTDACPKCGLEMGEHDGKKCPPKKKGGGK